MRNSVFHRHIEGFNQKLAALPLSIDGITSYAAYYLSELIQNREYFLQIYAQLLELLIGTSLPPKNISLLDIGSGNGLLGLFAKYCGVQKIILMEPDKDFLKASEILSQHLGIKPDAFLCSRFEDSESELDVEYVIGSDMIEHVYDLDVFIQGLSKLTPVRFVFSSASNIQNPLIRRRLEKIQQKDELIGEDDEESFEKGISGIPYFQIRKGIIQDHFPELAPEEINALSHSTRGKNYYDILDAVKRFRETGYYPIPAEGFNTCDPITGNWTERMLSFKTYRSMFESHGFRVKFSNGFYNQWEEGIPGAVKKMLNNFITLGGFKISPYFVISGSKN